MKHLFALLVVLLFPAGMPAWDAGGIRFHHFDAEPSLTEESCYAIYQDDMNFMWFATHRGLIRFDGASVKIYNRQQYPSLTSHVVKSIHPDREGRMWLNTNGGIVLFSPRDEVFTPVDLSFQGEPITDIGYMQVCHDGSLLFVSHSLLYRYTLADGRCRRLETGLPGIPEKQVVSFLQDDAGHLWLGYPNIGIFRYDSVGGRPVLLGKNEHTPMIITEYVGDSLLIGTLNRGLFVMDKRTGESRKVVVPHPGELFATDIYRMAEDEYWIASETGLYIFKEGRIVQHVTQELEDEMSLSTNQLLCVYRDNCQGVWIGTRHGGVNYFSANTNRIRKFYPQGTRHNLKGFHVTAFAEGAHGDWWVASDSEGLNHVTADGTWRHFATDTRPRLTNNHVTALRMRGDELWIATYTGGVNVLDTGTMEMTAYMKTPEPGSLKNNEDNCIFVDREQRVWIGSTTHLFRFNDEDATFTLIEGVQAWITDIEEVGDHLWLATRNEGLLCMDKEGGVVARYRHRENDSTSLSPGALTCLHADRYGRLWVGTDESGVCVMDLRTGTFQHITSRHQLPGDMVCKILEDNEGALWVSTNNGLAKIHPLARRVEQVWQNNHWLLSNAFFPNSGYVTSKGEVLLGNTKGFIAFSPSGMESPKHAFLPMATDLYLPDEQLSLLNRKHVVLPHNKATFSIRLAAFDYERENTGVYQYRLKGMDEGWLTCHHTPVASYNKLPSGTYELFVKYSADGMTWSDPACVLTLDILPPWWLSWYAVVFYLLVLALLCHAAVRYLNIRKTMELKKKKRIWEEKQKEESMNAKIDFFTNIAHEIRTPVSLIKASAEQLETEVPSNRNVEMLRRNTGRLETLVNELLSFRRIESGVDPIRLKPTDLCRVLQCTLDAFTPIIEKKGLVVEWAQDEAEPMVMADEQALSTVLTNLVGNATKYGRHRISLQIEIRPKQVCMTISNDGEGVPRHIRNHLFEPFIKGGVEDGSTGLGLSLVQLLTAKMHGHVEVEAADHLTSFILTLPLHSLKTKEAEAPSLSDGALRDKVLLIVEDNDDMRTFLCERFRECYAVAEARNGMEALSVLQEQEVAAIISDVMMPCMDGFELCRKVKSTLMTCHIPVLLLTAKTEEPEHVRGLSLGADAYVDKPFSVHKLMAQVRSLLVNRDMLQQRYAALSSREETEGQECGGNPLDYEFTTAMNDYIDAHLSEEMFHIDRLAQHLNMSRSNFHRKTKALIGLTPGEYVQRRRMNRAAALLTTGKYRVGEVCSMIGLRSASYFTHSFQKEFGVTPTQYMEGQEGLGNPRKR